MTTDYYLLGIDALAATPTRTIAVGAFDIHVENRRLNDLKSVDVAQAGALLRGGQAAIQLAREQSTPDRVNRIETVAAQLNAHARRVGELAKTPGAAYSAALDLKKWVLESFIEANVNEEGQARAGRIMFDMWSDVGEGTGNILSRVGNVVTAPFRALERAIALPTWLWWAGGAVVVGGLAYGGFKIAHAAAPTVARHYLRGG